MFLEIATFIIVGSIIGVFQTLLLCFISAILGGMIVQRQGMSTMMQVKKSLDQGLMPMNELFDGICVMIAGILLILPGFLSDVVAFFLLLPMLRQHLRGFVARKYGKNDTSYDPDTGIIEGDYIRVMDDPDLIKPPANTP